MALQKVLKKTSFHVVLDGRVVRKHGLSWTLVSPSQMVEDEVHELSQTVLLGSCVHRGTYCSVQLVLCCVDGLVPYSQVDGNASLCVNTAFGVCLLVSRCDLKESFASLCM